MKLKKEFLQKLADAMALVEEVKNEVQEQLDKENEKDNPNDDKVSDLETELDKLETAHSALDEVEANT